jgi:hypothetical protein
LKERKVDGAKRKKVGMPLNLIGQLEGIGSRHFYCQSKKKVSFFIYGKASSLHNRRLFCALSTERAKTEVHIGCPHNKALLAWHKIRGAPPSSSCLYLLRDGWL